VTREWRVDRLRVVELGSEPELAEVAAAHAAAAIRAAAAERGHARVLLATGRSQVAFLELLVARRDVPWEAVDALHLDEYVGLADDHPASFRRYLHDRVVARVPLRSFHGIVGEAADPDTEARRYATLLAEEPVDVCFVGIGENGHLAFDEPDVADFDDPLAVRVVEIAARTRRQQVDEGCFERVDDVPDRAITVTIPALLRTRTLLAVVPEARKASPVRDALLGAVTPSCPASALRRHPDATLFLEPASASLLAGAR